MGHIWSVWTQTPSGAHNHERREAYCICGVWHLAQFEMPQLMVLVLLQPLGLNEITQPRCQVHSFSTINGVKQKQKAVQNVLTWGRCSMMKTCLTGPGHPSGPLHGAFPYALVGIVITTIASTHALVGSNNYICFKYLKLKSMEKIYRMRSWLWKEFLTKKIRLPPCFGSSSYVLNS